MTVRPLHQPTPDPEVVALLETALERARSGEVCGVGLVLVPRGGDVEAGWQWGEGCTVQALHYGASTLTADLLGCRMGTPGTGAE